MSSKRTPRGIKDKVVILGMGCSVFGEHWDKNADDLIVDTHGADVIPDVWAILESAFEIFGVFPVLLERDFNLPPLAELLREVERIAQLQRRWTERADGRRQPA